MTAYRNLSSLSLHRIRNHAIVQQRILLRSPPPPRCFHVTAVCLDDNKDDVYSHDRINAMVGHNFPDFIEHWNRDTFRKVGYGLSAATLLTLAGPSLWFGLTHHAVSYVPAVLMGTATATYWHIGLKDIHQKSHAIRRNFPVLGNLRYVFETVRPELHQYIVESDSEGRPFDRNHRAQVYRRAKGVDDTLPFGTRRDVYEVSHEWACHSMWPTKITDEEAKRYTIGASEFGTTQPYSASVFNVSGMSYGAISDHAILALSKGAKMGNFFQNTGEGGVSRFHIQGGGDLVWNMGTGYFGCGSGAAEKRVFEPQVFQETLQAAEGNIKMIEIKLSQGAKPGHGGILPKAKITREIATTRKLDFPATDDCHSPPRHSSFSNAYEMVEFIAKVRELSGGLPVGVKLCVGEPADIATLCKAMVEIGNGPDFITVDGAEGGTGAAPPEFSNSVGFPLEEGIIVVRNFLVGSGLKDKVAINASGRVTSGFGLVKKLSLGADITSAARAFMLSLGCIQALKCNTNKCPTGVATLDKDLMFGLDPELKSSRGKCFCFYFLVSGTRDTVSLSRHYSGSVYNFHKRTLHSASEIVGVLGKNKFSDVLPSDIMRRVKRNEVRTLSEIYPDIQPGCLLGGDGPQRLQALWDTGGANDVASSRWIY